MSPSLIHATAEGGRYNSSDSHIDEARPRAYRGRMGKDDKTPAEIELEDTLRSIRGVGENAGGAEAESVDDTSE